MKQTAPGVTADANVDTRIDEVEALMRRVCLDTGRTTSGVEDPAGAIAVEHLGTGGKRLRARLALEATHALGVEGSAAVAWAAACELLHNATLLHDDVEDGDRVRRGQPTAWVRHGVPQAINAGDLLFVVPFACVVDGTIGPSLGAAGAGLAACLARHGAAVIRGQAMELELLHAGRLGRADYLEVVRQKTSALFALPVDGAHELAGSHATTRQKALDAFAELGVLFQIQDDVLDLFGDKGREAPGSDIGEGKISILVVAHLEQHPDDRAWLLSILSTPRDETSPSDIVEVTRRFRDGGALAAVKTDVLERRRRLAAAQLQLGDLGPVLGAITDRVLEPIAHLLA